MNESEFEPITNKVDYGYIQELLDNGYMTSGILCITDRDRRAVISVKRNYGLIGMPIIDLASLEEKESPEHYISYRLRKRFDLDISDKSLRLVKMKSQPSPHMNTIRNKQYPDITQRVYVPVLSLYEGPINSDVITWANPNEVYRNIVHRDQGRVIGQLGRIHKQIFSKVIKLEV